MPSLEPDTECNEHQPDICTVRLIAVYLDSPCRKDKNNGYRSKLNQSSHLLAVVVHAAARLRARYLRMTAFTSSVG